MKARAGFVANSSSSSFTIYGVHIDDIEDEGQLPKGFEKSGLGVWYGDPNWREGLYVGRTWEGISDDETGKQFKESVEKALKQLFPDRKLEPTTIEEAWYDG